MMAKRKARVVWLYLEDVETKSFCPDAVWDEGEIGAWDKKNYIRFVESPPRKKARKK